MRLIPIKSRVLLRRREGHEEDAGCQQREEETRPGPLFARAKSLCLHEMALVDV
jgi:hypothetical protein